MKVASPPVDPTPVFPQVVSVSTGHSRIPEAIEAAKLTTETPPATLTLCEDGVFEHKLMPETETV
jgi:hypothetical protein